MYIFYFINRFLNVLEEKIWWYSSYKILDEEKEIKDIPLKIILFEAIYFSIITSLIIFFILVLFYLLLK